MQNESLAERPAIEYHPGTYVVLALAKESIHEGPISPGHALVPSHTLVPVFTAMIAEGDNAFEESDYKRRRTILADANLDPGIYYVIHLEGDWHNAYQVEVQTTVMAVDQEPLRKRLAD